MAKIRNPYIVLSGGNGDDRPADWLQIPSMSGTYDEVYILIGVLDGTNKTAVAFGLSASASGDIDWGDGSSEGFPSGNNQTFRHTYSSNSVSGSTWTTHNNTKQALIHIIAPRGKIGKFTLDITNEIDNDDGVTITYNNSSVTNIYEVNANVSSCQVTCSSSNAKNTHSSLERFIWKGTTTNTSFQGMFRGCGALRKIELDVSSATDMRSFFERSFALKEVPYLKTNSNANMQSFAVMSSGSNPAFTCLRLKIKPSSLQGAFQGCAALQKVELDTRQVKTMTSTFTNCYSLKSVRFDLSSVTSNIAFSNVTLLQDIVLYNLNPTTTSAITLTTLTSARLSKAALIELFNSLPANPSGTRTITIGSTNQGYLTGVYVKQTDDYYSVILPTSDNTADISKTYYVYNENTNDYVQVTPDFSSNNFYYELKTGTWKKYVICESTDVGATEATTWITTKGYTLA